MDARALARQGYTYAEIGRLLGRDWRTVKRYLETGAQPVYRRRRMPSKLDEFKPVIDQWLAATPRLLATRIHQDLVRDYGFEGSYNTVRRYVERSRPTASGRGARSALRPRPGIRPRSTGRTSSRSGPAAGSSCRCSAFTWCSGIRRDSFCALTGSQDLVTFWACHRAAFAHFGGVPRQVLYDRTKTVVRAHVGRERSLGENVFHPEALASAHHYGFSLKLCKAYRPQTKGKVESDVPYVRERLLRAHAFDQLRARQPAPGSTGTRTSPAGACTARTANSSRSAPNATAPRWARCRPRPIWSSSARRASSLATACSASRAAATRVPDARPGERVELVLGHQEIEIYSTVGRAPARAPRARAPRPRASRPGRELGAAGAGAAGAAGSRGAPPPSVGLPGPDRWLS